MPRRQRALDTDPAAAARAAGLRYVSDAGPGITRIAKTGGGFRYVDDGGRPIRSAAEIQRIDHLAVPPAWSDVWICPQPNGHIQAIGRDARRRKQYRYHERWREARDATKYERTIAFGEVLPRIRARVDRDLRRPDLSRERVLATIVRLLDTTCIRVGNEEYARENRSFGLTTMRDRHVEVEGSTLRFQFRGKSGKQHSVDLTDRRVARVITRLQELPGQQLFQWIDDGGEIRGVESDDVNAYIREAAGDDFTAKDFRTWAGTVLAAWALQELGEYVSPAQAKRQVVEAVESVARHLGNTPAVCRRCYVHPEVITAHLDGHLLHSLGQRAAQTLSESIDELSPREAAVLAFLRRRIAQAADYSGAQMSVETDYATYLRIDALLDLQQPLSDGAHDEMLFIVVHQVYELWFKLILHELDAAATALEAGKPHDALPPLRRAVSVERLLIEQLLVLESMSPDGFMRFRDPLAPASGFQSTQFREIEALSGAGEIRHLRDPGRTEVQRAQLAARLEQRTLYMALATAMRLAGLDFPDGDGDAHREVRLASLASLYRNHDEMARALLHQVCEGFVDHDETIARWRHHHALMAAREIGSRTGTGGSLGVAYLNTTLDRRFFPELWEVRNRL